MCGIFGIWQYGEGDRPVDLTGVRRATDAIRHRGPDDEGYLLVDTRARRAVLCGGPDTDPALSLPPLEAHAGGPSDLVLGFRRLSILDLSPAGHQPMAGADGACWMIFNGEIYNYVELREELARLGHQFRTGTDTEVVLAAYKQWGADCLKRFIGMWAFALWDSAAGRLLLARDPFGIKPLYYSDDGRRLVFASEIKALLAYGGVGRAVNPQRLYDYLLTGVTDHSAETLFSEVRQLPPAHSLSLPLGGQRAARPERYWRIDLDRKLDLSFDEAAARLRELFIDSVRIHLRSDVPVGAALSGGIDSSAIVTAMRELEPALDLHTFSYAADDPAISEERWVDIVAGASRSRVHKVRPTPDEMVADLDQLIATQDEPFGSTSIYAQHRVFRLAREAGITVMLDGQGADEMLAGYRNYLAARLATLLREGRLLRANSLLRSVADMPDVKGRALVMAAGGMLFPSLGGGKIMPPALRGLVRRAAGVNGTTLTALNNEWFAERGAALPRPANGRRRDFLQKTLHQTLVETSLPMLLRYEDRNSMAHSIESRVPFLTTPLAEFILALPEEYVIARDGTSKSVFRKAMRGIVPDAVLDRRDKIGFSTPERKWLATLRPWVEGTLRGDAAARVPALNLAAVKAEWGEILAGTRGFDFRVWRWLNVIRWAERMGVTF